jgi:hypothetical protein
MNTLERIRADLKKRYPTLARRRIEARPDKSAIALGHAQSGKLMLIPERARLEHAFHVGTTGSGKTTAMDISIRQDIAAGRGVLVMDPHGEHPDSLYRSLLSWIKARRIHERRQVHLIDPSETRYAVGFNPLARDSDTDISVTSGVTLEAFARAWGGEDTSTKPTIERVLTTTFSALCELNLSLAEAPMLLDRADQHGLRRFALEHVKDQHTRRELERLHEVSEDERRKADFDIEVLGPINRLARFLRPAAISTMVGQTAGLDFGKAFDEGHIILCNLSGSNRVYEKDADLLGRLITRFAFFHAKRRQKPERAFFIYMDECHRYLSGDLENILAESRKYGIGAILATQWLQQLRSESENMLAAVLNATNLKIVFRAKDPQEAEQLAEMVIPFDLEVPVRALVKPTVVGYRRIQLKNESESKQSSVTNSDVETFGNSLATTETRGGSTAKSHVHASAFSHGDGSQQGTANSLANTGGRSGGSSSSLNLDPDGSFFGPAIIGEGSSSDKGWNDATTRGVTNNQSTNTQRNWSESDADGEIETDSWSEAVQLVSQYSRAIGKNFTEAQGRSRGHSEALEAILADMPSAVHSRDNIRYFAGLFVRKLRTGQALVNYVGKYGMVSALVRVPHVPQVRLAPDAYSSIRQELLSRSAWAITAEKATQLQQERELSFFKAFDVDEFVEPETFRTKAPPVQPKRGRTRPASSGRRRSRKAEQDSN